MNFDNIRLNPYNRIIFNNINAIIECKTLAIYCVLDKKIMERRVLDTTISHDYEKSIITMDGLHVVLDCKDVTKKLIKSIIESLIPWRKGPFCIHFDTKDYLYIDSEWQSNKKMSLLYKAFDNLDIDINNKMILDVGCNNGYYIFNLALRARHIIGIDPIEIFFLQYYLFYKLCGINNMDFRICGIEDFKISAYFDIVLCLGILYHRKDPLQTLRTIKNRLHKHSTLILETLILQDSKEIALCPYPSYAGMKNVYFIFSKKALENLAYHAGFKECTLLNTSYTTNAEQRSTHFSKKSLGDLLSQESQLNKDNVTIEGHDSPCRGIFALTI